MSLCNLLKRPQRFDLSGQIDSLKELELSLDLFNRGRLAIRTDGLARDFLDQACENALNTFLQNYQYEIQELSDRLDQHITPAKVEINAFLSALTDKDCDQAPEYLLNAVVNFFEWLSLEHIEETLTQCFDLLHQEMENGINALFEEMICPAIDRIVELLEGDFANGLTDSSAFNRFMLSKDLKRLKEQLMAFVNEVPPYTREYYLDPILAFIKNSIFFSRLDKVREVVASSKEVVEKLLALIKTVSANASAAGPGPGRYLWYASWLLQENFWEIDQQICKGPLFTLDSAYAAALDLNQLPAALLTDFNDQFSLSGTPTLQQVPTDFHWQLKGTSGDPDFLLIRRNGNGKIKVFQLYPEAEWTKIAPMAPYTFGTFSPATADDWAYHSSWFVDMLKTILHSLSMEPTAATGSKSDALSNLGNLLLHLTYGGLKLSGPKGCGWNQTDPNLNNFWAKSAIPFITTMITSLEGIHRNSGADAGPGGGRFTYWLSLAAKDLSEKYLIDHWCDLFRDGLLAYITVTNYQGPRPAPSDPTDGRPLNREQMPALVALSSDLMAWLSVAIFPKVWYGFPGSQDETHGRSLLAHWLGTGSVLAVAGTFFGLKIAESIGQVEDTKALCKSLKRGIGSVWAKFPVYLYLANEGSTNRGRISHDAYPMMGYASVDTSPYFLPFPNNAIHQCVQGNMGLWSHNALQDISLIYAYDFALDFGDEVRAARAGILWAFVDHQPDDTDTNNDWGQSGNFVQILHSGLPVAGHDRNLQKELVKTYAIYQHAKSGSIQTMLSFPGKTVEMHPVGSVLTNATVKASFLAEMVDLDLLFANDNSATIAVGVSVPGGNFLGPVFINQGQAIMQAGNTGKVAFNQLHMHVQPAKQELDGKVTGLEPYSIPYVFKDVKGKLFSRPGVARSGHYYQSENV